MGNLLSMKQGLEKFYNLIEALEQLPSIGKKSATRMAYNMVLGDPYGAMKIAHAIEEAVSSVKRCVQCGGISEHELCEICADDSRDDTQLCIVENPKDLLIIEEGGHYRGRYFVIENMEELDIERLRAQVQAGVSEVIFAMTPGIAGDSIILYLEDKLESPGVSFYKIAQGVPTGVSLENVDSISLGRAFEARIRV